MCRRPLLAEVTALPSSYRLPRRPSPLLALVCLAIAYRLRPAWLAIDIQQAAADEQISPQRVSRLASRALASFEESLATFSRRGRPPLDHRHRQVESELALTSALLATATQLLAHLPIRRRHIRQLFVGAWLHLKEHHRISQHHFCRVFSIRPRTFRSWLKQGVHVPSPPPVPPPPKPPRKRPPRRPRFGFDLLLPETQFAADTTDLSACGIPLKLVASQDIGGRDVSLLDAILVDDNESAQHVGAVLEQSLSKRPGAQLITDQGTPYLAEATRKLIEDLDVDHAPQREAHPQGKATIERAFLTAKQIARPLLSITDRVAQAVPALKTPSLAKQTAQLLLTAILRAYQHGARAARSADLARGSLSSEELALAAEDSRQKARAEFRSHRLFLEHIHSLYLFPISLSRFCRAFRFYPLAVLQQAEQALRKHAPRPDIKNLYRYFSAIVRNLNDDHQLRCRRNRDARSLSQQLHRDRAERLARFTLWYNQPLHWLAYAFDALSAWWRPDLSRFVSNHGPGHGALTGAVRRIVELHGAHSAWSASLGAFHAFAKRSPLSHDALAAIEQVLRTALSTEAGPEPIPPSASAILALAGQTPRPPPSPHLRN